MSITERGISEPNITGEPSRFYIKPDLGDILAMSPYDIWDTAYRDQMGLIGTSVTNVKSLVSSRGLSQSGAAGLRPTYNEAGYITFDATGTEFLDVTLSTALYNFLHDGTGCTVLTAAKGTDGQDASFLLCSGGASSEKGFAFALDDDGVTHINNLRPTVSNGTAAVISTNTAQNNQCNVGAKEVYGFTYKTQAGTDAENFVNGVSTATLAEAATPSSLDAVNNLNFGRFVFGGTGSSYFEGDWYGTIIFDRVLTAQELKVCSDYLARNF